MKRAGRPRKSADRLMKTVCMTLMPAHITQLGVWAEELTKQHGRDISVSAVVRALIRHAHDSPPRDWKVE